MSRTKREKDVHLMLTAGADRLTCKDLLKIAEALKKTDANVHIRLGFSQVLLGLPRSSRRYVEKALREMGYECVRFLTLTDRMPTYDLF